MYASEPVEFWQSRYETQSTPWDLAGVAPPLSHFMEDYPEIALAGKMAALGTGLGHDAAYFGQKGFEVIGFDYAPEAVKEANKHYGQWASFVQADIFKLDSQYFGQFDVVLEHTCFCAIPPARRPDYVNVVHKLLKPEGYFLGLIWSLFDQEEGGPPFASSKEELESLFKPHFKIQLLELAHHSIDWRKGQEFICLFQKKAI